MHKIAITGIIGSGKSTMGFLLEEMGLDFISADLLAKQAFRPDQITYAPLLKLLSTKYLDQDRKNFNFQKVAESAFQDQKLLSQIEVIIHPFVWNLMQKKINKLESTGKKVVFCEVPLLFEKKWENRFDTVIVVAISPKQLKRYLKEPEETKKRMQFQISQEEKIKRADYVIWNLDSLEELRNQVLNLVKTLKIEPGI